MVALSIFGVGTILLMQLAPKASQYANHGRLMSEANGLAQAKLEELIGLPSSDGLLAAGTHEDDGNPIDGVFNRSWEVTENVPITGMRRIEIRVSMTTTMMADSVTTLVTYF
jgi:hypothetical protein